MISLTESVLLWPWVCSSDDASMTFSWSTYTVRMASEYWSNMIDWTSTTDIIPFRSLSQGDYCWLPPSTNEVCVSHSKSTHVFQVSWEQSHGAALELPRVRPQMVRSDVCSLRQIQHLPIEAVSMATSRGGNTHNRNICFSTPRFRLHGLRWHDD